MGHSRHLHSYQLSLYKCEVPRSSGILWRFWARCEARCLREKAQTVEGKRAKGLPALGVCPRLLDPLAGAHFLWENAISPSKQGWVTLKLWVNLHTGRDCSDDPEAGDPEEVKVRTRCTVVIDPWHSRLNSESLPEWKADWLQDTASLSPSLSSGA